MHDQIEQLRNYARMVWRHRWAALLGAAILCAAGWFVIVLMPNKYEVTTKIYLDSNTLLTPLLQGIAADDSRVRRDNASMMQRTLLVRPNLEKVVRAADLDLEVDSPEEFDKLLIKLASEISVSGSATGNVFVIGYQHKDPDTANQVVEAILNLFVERSLGESRRDTSRSRTFLLEQINEHESRLNEAEQRLKNFKRENVGRMPSEGRTYYMRLEDLREAIADTELALSEARNRVAALESRITQSRSAAREALEGQAGPFSPYDERIAAMEANIDQLLLTYTEEHPDVLGSKRLLADLRANREAYLKEQGVTGAGGERESAARLADNPAFQQLTVSLAEASGEVAALQTRLAEFRRRESELVQLVDTIPRVEAELVKLNRDYDVIKVNYEKLVQRYEALKIAGEVEQSNTEQFRIIEPPRVPLVPVSPDRPKLSIVVLVLGLAGGIGLGVLLGMLRPAIYTKAGISELTDLPVFGVVSRMWTPRERFKRRMEVATYALGCTALIGVFAVLMVLYRLNVDLDLAARIGRLGQALL